MNRLVAHQQAILSLTKLLVFALAQLPFLRAAPLRNGPISVFEEAGEGVEADDPTLWIYLGVAVGLVLLGGAFAGLTIALMGQDEIYLQVLKSSGDKSEKKNAARVLGLLDKGKHWVLVTLLLSNVITNETLPIVLDRSLGGGWPAVLGSTVLIVIFGEIIPQSICVRYGLPIGAWMYWPVLTLMYLLGPVAWPTAKLLDRVLGEDHGTVYKRAGLKTLVTLHKTLGSAGDQLNSDEVTIISAVLDLKAKPVGAIMTPMKDVFTMSADTILDEETMNVILSAGYSRIPIHAPDNEFNFVGMLLVKMLITYDPEDGKPVRDFALATLPETRPETSCLDIVNFFQEGKSHMVLVSENPAEDSGALGVVTLEDVIEELIGEEIIDESDVYIDVHKAIRRIHPAPRTRVPKGAVVTDTSNNTGKAEEELDGTADHNVPPNGVLRRVATQGPPQRQKSNSVDLSSSPKAAFLLRRTSGGSNNVDHGHFSRRVDMPEMREHLKHLGPSNLASRPRTTRYNTVKIKAGGTKVSDSPLNDVKTAPQNVASKGNTHDEGVGEGLLRAAGKNASDGVHAIQEGYGTIERPKSSDTPDTSNRGTQVIIEPYQRPTAQRADSEISVATTSTITSLPKQENRSSAELHGTRSARSGSITENVIEVGGIKKVILETTSNGPEEGQAEEARQSDEGSAPQESTAGKKKRRKKRKRAEQGESAPLLDDHQ